MDDEQFEHIPWEQLSPRRPDQRWPRVAYMVAGAVVVAALAAAVSRSMGRGPTAAEPTTDLLVTSLAPVTTLTIPAPEPYSEADLGALAPDEGVRQAAALAEWFVADYFTADGSYRAAEEVRAHFPEETSLVIPQDRPEVRSFVEWARAIEVEAAGVGEYRVIVVVRMLEAVGDAPYQRMPARAVEVGVTMTGDGPAVKDLPSPVEVPRQGLAGQWPEGVDVPPEVVAVALQEVATWGTEPTIEAGALVVDRWRVVVTVADAAGVRWPLVVWVDG